MLNVQHVNDANAYVSVYRAGTDRVTLTGEGIHFNGATGEVIREDPAPTVVAGIKDFLTGLHLQHFRHWLLRWLYVLGGLAGCACIATGFIFFVEKRKRQHAKQGLQGARWVDAFAVATVPGLLIATFSMLVANRLLPAEPAARQLGDRRLRGRLAGLAAPWPVAHRAHGAGPSRTGLGRTVLGRGAAGRGRGAAELDHHRRPSAAHHRQRLLAGGGRRPVGARGGLAGRGGRAHAAAPCRRDCRYHRVGVERIGGGPCLRP